MEGKTDMVSKILPLIEKEIAKGNNLQENNVLRTLADENKGIIGSLIAEVEKKYKDSNYMKSLFKVIRILHDIFPEQVIMQINKNPVFPKVISKYIGMTELQNLSGDSFVLLAYISDCMGIENVLTKHMIEKLFDSLSSIENPEVFDAIIFLIFKLSSILNKMKQNNFILKLCKEHQNSRYVEEILIKLIIKCKGERLIICMEFALLVLKDPDLSKKFFYTNDLNILIDVILQEAENDAIKEIRLMYFEMLYFILTTSEYKSSSYKYEEIVKLINGIAENPETDEETLNLIQKIASLEQEESSN